jgi:hypothetical protein
LTFFLTVTENFYIDSKSCFSDDFDLHGEETAFRSFYPRRTEKAAIAREHIVGVFHSYQKLFYMTLAQTILGGLTMTTNGFLDLINKKLILKKKRLF